MPTVADAPAIAVQTGCAVKTKSFGDKDCKVFIPENVTAACDNTVAPVHIKLQTLYWFHGDGTVVSA